MNTSFTMVSICAALLMVIFLLFAKPILVLFGASENALPVRPPLSDDLCARYLSIYGYYRNEPFHQCTGIRYHRHAFCHNRCCRKSAARSAFYFFFDMGIQGAAIATVLSQIFSAIFVLRFLRFRAEYRVRFLKKSEFSEGIVLAGNIASLGTAGFIMQLTNSLVTICCNNILATTGGDLYVSVMTIISSIRQMVDTPIHAIMEGSSPVISYNYGARRPKRVKQAGLTMSALALIYAILAWSVVLFAPRFLIGIFSSESGALRRCNPCHEAVFFRFHFHASAVHRSDNL